MITEITEIRQLVQSIHDSDSRIMMVAAGAGTNALSDLLGVAGASRTLLEALIPYSEAAFDEFLGQTPPQYVSADTAKLMAGRALTRARWLEKTNMPVVGVGCTATIVTDRPKLGQHRAHIAVWQPQGLSWYGLKMRKGARDRVGEEILVSQVILNTLAKACGTKLQLSLSLKKGDQLESERFDFTHMANLLYHGKTEYFGIQSNGQIHTAKDTPPKALLCGAFNPLHDGHLALARAASEILDQPVAFELSAANVDKRSLSIDKILDHMAQFAGRWPVYTSTAPTFVEKARLYPGATFVVGHDTAERVLHPRYYQNSTEELKRALAEIQQHNSCFLVAGRVDSNGNFRHLEDLEIPSPFEQLFKPIPGNQFRKDISSTKLRQTGQRGSR